MWGSVLDCGFSRFTLNQDSKLRKKAAGVWQKQTGLIRSLSITIETFCVVCEFMIIRAKIGNTVCTLSGMISLLFRCRVKSCRDNLRVT